ncbi:MAG: tRNA uridine-5-carboxymethylaminomethyl(34) synthesis GTPase MnmE [Rhodothermaceae bacterium]|nr:tRNA uridine-5-carboxymethylaminomethyl(34) synthesis GTPase MnmE [Rhodothermaceae bacterium]
MDRGAAMTETIAALATARGQAALAIVRLSGPEAVQIVASRFSQGEALLAAESHTAHVGFLLDGEGERLDQVVVTLFRAPRTATGEDVVEVTCHGGDLAPQLVLRSLLDAGACLAEPGEFTQRAFLNGKLDLTQAEAVADLIHAQSGLAHRAALHQLEGRVAGSVAHIREALVQTTALIELELDFSEEDVEFADRSALGGLLAEADDLLTELLDSYRLGALVRDGVRVVIGGRPNAGKSTLLNALVERDRAIVSATPGTTRDEIEAEATMEGLRYRFVDTAGLRDTADAIEAEGVRRTRRAIDRADALLYVVDATTGLDEEEQAFLDRLAADRPELPVLLVANKTDLLPNGTARPAAAFALSAKTALADPSHLDALRHTLREAVASDLTHAEGSMVVVNERHRRHLDAAREAVHRAQAALRSRSGGDTLALDLRAALHELGAITGAITNEDVLGAIFSQFCIGK